MPKVSAKILAVWLSLCIKLISASNLEIDCRRDFTLPQLTIPNNIHCNCNSASPGCKENDTTCYNDCFKETSTVCYIDSVVNNALTDGASFYGRLKSFESNLLTKDILTKETQCGKISTERSPLSSETQDIFDASNILEISLSFLGKTIEGRGNTDNDNRAFRHFAYRPSSRCTYNTSKVCTEKVPDDCNKFRTIRSYNGICNNIRKKKMGASMTPYFSLISPQYDSMQSSFGSHNARKLSILLNSTSRTKYTITDEIPNILFVFGFQAFDHEIGSLQDYQYPRGGNAPRCCGYNGEQKLPEYFKNTHCMPMYISKDDPVLSSTHNCIEFVRAQRVHDSCQLAKQRMVNGVTTALDGSIIYGSSEDDNMFTRDENSRNFTKDDSGRRVLGDFRNSQTANLFLFHDLFANLHDMVIEKLQNYEQTRKFVSGTMQKIFIDLIATAVGKTLAEAYGLFNMTDCYDSNIPLVTLTEYSHSAGRFCHEFVPDNIEFHYNNDSTIVHNLKSLFGFDTLETENDSNALLWGMVRQPMQQKGISFVLQNEFEEGCDLFSIDVQREKDAEVEAYIKYLKYYRAACIKDFDDLVQQNIIPQENVDILRRAFKDVSKVPLSMGSRLECTPQDGFLPPTVAQITLDQVQRLRCADRYFWTRKEIYSQRTITAISKMTIRELVCCYTNGYISELPENSFLTEGPNNPLKPCNCRSVSEILNL